MHKYNFRILELVSRALLTVLKACVIDKSSVTRTGDHCIPISNRMTVPTAVCLLLCLLYTGNV